MRLVAVVLFLLFGVHGLCQEGYKRWQLNAKAGVIVAQASANILFVRTKVDIPAGILPVVDLRYFVRRNIALELIASGSKHKLEVLTPLGLVDFGDVWIYPLNLNVQYHFGRAALRPYAGLGVNWTQFNLTGLDDNQEKAILDPVLGFGIQAGLDYRFSSRWSIVMDFKKLFLRTKADVSGLSTMSVPLVFRLFIDPWLGSVGLGYRF